MLITTYGATAEIIPTRAQVVETMQLITSVHRAKGEETYLCPYFYAREITARILAGAVASKVAARASRLDAGGRIWRAKIRLA